MQVKRKRADDPAPSEEIENVSCSTRERAGQCPEYSQSSFTLNQLNSVIQTVDCVFLLLCGFRCKPGG